MKSLLKYVLFFYFITNITLANAVTMIRFGIGYFYPPFEYLSATHQSYGYDLEIAQALCAQLNAQCTFTTMKLSDMFQNLDNRNVDAVIGAISITEERQQYVDFTLPYYQNTASFVGAKNKNIDIKNLDGEVIGAAQGTTFINFLNLLYAGKVKVKVYPTTEDLLSALAGNDVDLIMLDTPVANYWINNDGGQFKIVGLPIQEPQLLGMGYGIAVRKGNISLLANLNRAIVAIEANGTLAAITKKYFVTF